MAKTPAPVYTTAFGLLAFSYIDRPDDKAPDGASWKPDGKYKGTIVVDGDEHDALRSTLIGGLRAQFPQAPTDDDELKLPIRPGETLSGKKAEQFAGKMVLEAKSDYKPAVYDSLGQKVPDGTTARSGDIVRFKVSPYYFSKDEEIVERVNGKMVKTRTTVYGVSLRLSGVQIKRKGAGGGEGGGGFDAIEDGEFQAGDADNSADAQEEAPRQRRSVAGGDF